MGGTSVGYDVLERILDRREKPNHLPLPILARITDDFSDERKIGEGGFGVVYKGVIQNWSVAVKRITVNCHTIDDKLFDREVKNLLKIIDHPNVVRFLGFCSNTHREVITRGSEDILLPQIRERLLCFEYISNGSLDKHITDELRGLEWNIRYQIIKQICEGLQYLHKMGIIHMDLKPANIMIDNNMVPKITDFGLARSDVKSRTTGNRFISQGYSAPEYQNGGSTTIQCDIYSLGVIINELITGRKGTPDKRKVLRRWRHRWSKSASHTQLRAQQVTKCIEIAERCLANEPNKRPSLEDIIYNLDENGNMNTHFSEAGQISAFSGDDDDLLGIEPLRLCFALELNKEISNEVVLTNETGNSVAFNIKTVSQQQYCTQPDKGIVPPNSKSTVKITLQAQETTTLGSMPRDDEFIVQSTKVRDGLTDEEVTEDMFNDEAAGKLVDEVNLTVVYDDEPEKPQAVQSLEPNVPFSEGTRDTGGQANRRRLNFRPPQIISSVNESRRYRANDDRAPVDLMTGAMGSLLPKLRKLLMDRHNLPEDVNEDVESLEEQLTGMYTALCNVPHEELHNLNLQDKKWANKVRDISYDIEDMVDHLLVRIEGSEPITNEDGFRSLLQNMLNRVSKVADRSKEVKLTTSLPNKAVTSTEADPRLSALYEDHRRLVGIDGPRDELVRRLTGLGDRQQLKIISIYGEGGSGKTTLAKSVFDRLTKEILLKAFVSVGRNPDTKRVIKNVLYELDKNTNGQILKEDWDERQLIDKLQNELENKRYFIIIDDIWDIQSWNIIKCAFSDNGKGSIVITTSRIFEVAANAGETCKLEPLSYADSKELFYARLTSKGTSTSNQPDEQSTKLILEKCGGLPLAIITIASLLDGKPLVDWPEVYNRIGFGLEDTSRAENNTKKILLLSYNDLPCHLKTCLLYLSIFPEDHVIDKNTLVWKWIAEGFVHEERGETLFKVGERYFNQLINRSIIQPVEYTDTWADVTTEKFAIYACRVHDMVLDMICGIAEEENFVTILGGDELQQSSSSQNNARILAVQKRGLEQHDLDNIIGKRKATRSFNATGCLPRLIALDSLLPSFRFLRVLSFFFFFVRNLCLLQIIRGAYQLLPGYVT